MLGVRSILKARRDKLHQIEAGVIFFPMTVHWIFRKSVALTQRAACCSLMGNKNLRACYLRVACDDKHKKVIIVLSDAAQKCINALRWDLHDTNVCQHVPLVRYGLNPGPGNTHLQYFLLYLYNGGRSYGLWSFSRRKKINKADEFEPDWLYSPLSVEVPIHHSFFQLV